jgi:transcription elongation GreA/GreB family factor
MDKLTFKKRVLQRAKEEQQKLIEDFMHQIKDLQNSDEITDDDQLDEQQQSLDSNNSDLISAISDELNFANEEMELLNKMQVGNKVADFVTIGAVVKTDSMTFYPSVSIEKFVVDGEELFGLSLKAPIYEEMKGKRKGETFQYKGTEYTIQELF